MINAGKLYQENAVHSADSLTLVLQMYDMLIADLRHAIEALRVGSIEQRTNHIKHALSVLEQLSLSIDFKNGGETATSLDAFYSIVRAKVLQAQFQQSRELLEKQIELVESVRDAWREVSARQRQSTQLSAPAAAVYAGGDDGASISNWRA